MLELVGSEDKDTKVKVTVEIDRDGDIGIKYDGIVVAYLKEGDGHIWTSGLSSHDRETLRGKGIYISCDELGVN